MNVGGGETVAVAIIVWMLAALVVVAVWNVVKRLHQGRPPSVGCGRVPDESRDR